MTRRKRVALALGGLVFLAGCGAAPLLLGFAPQLIDEAQDIHKIRISPGEVTLAGGQSADFSVSGYSIIGNKVGITGGVRWTVDDDKGLLANAADIQNDRDTRVTVEVASTEEQGTVYLTAEVSGKVAQAKIKINEREGIAVSVYPPVVGLPAGGQLRFVAVVLDTRNVSLSRQQLAQQSMSVAWSSSPDQVILEPGDNNDVLVRVPASLGGSTVTLTAAVPDPATQEQQKGTAELRISPGSPHNRIHAVNVFPEVVRVYANSRQQFVAVPVDETGVALQNATVSWIKGQPSPGSIDRSTGLLQSSTTPVEGGRITAMVEVSGEDPVLGLAEVTVVSGSP